MTNVLFKKSFSADCNYCGWRYPRWTAFENLISHIELHTENCTYPDIEVKVQ